MHEIQYVQDIKEEMDACLDEKRKEKMVAFYNDCLFYWEGGAVNVNAGLRLLVRGMDSLHLNANTNPFIRLTLAHIAYLLRLDGIGGFKPQDSTNFNDTLNEIRNFVSREMELINKRKKDS